MIFEIGELDNASQSTRWAEGIGDPLHVDPVVLAFGACKKHERGKLNWAHPPATQLPDRDLRTL
jgi:hypothetical protein